MEEITFVVTEAQEGGFEAKGVGISIFTEADSWAALKDEVRDAVRCHFEDDNQRLIRLHYIKDEIIAA